MEEDREWRKKHKKDDWRGHEESDRGREGESRVGVVASPLDCY